MSTTLIASPEAILAQIDLLTASVKDLRKATATAFKQHKSVVAAAAKASTKKSKKASGSDSGSVSSGGSRTNTNSWQAWTAYVLPAKGESGTERAERYTEFKEAYNHPVNGTKQGVMIAYLGHRAYLDGSKEGGKTPEYTEFLAAFAERKASVAATATVTSVVPIVKRKKAAVLELDDSHSVSSTEEREASLGTAIIPMTPHSNSSASLPPPPAKGKKASATPVKCPTVKVLALTDGPVAGKKKALPALTFPAPPASLISARVETIPESSSNSSSNSSAVATAVATAVVKPVVKTVAKKGKKAAAAAIVVTAPIMPMNPRATMAPWEFNGTTYLKNDVGQVWSAEGEWCGVYNEGEDLIDETVEEPVWPPVEDVE